MPFRECHSYFLDHIIILSSWYVEHKWKSLVYRIRMIRSSKENWQEIFLLGGNFASPQYKAFLVKYNWQLVSSNFNIKLWASFRVFFLVCFYLMFFILRFTPLSTFLNTIAVTILALKIWRYFCHLIIRGYIAHDSIKHKQQWDATSGIMPQFKKG